jgi:hypothetical protein
VLTSYNNGQVGCIYYHLSLSYWETNDALDTVPPVGHTDRSTYRNLVTFNSVPMLNNDLVPLLTNAYTQRTYSLRCALAPERGAQRHAPGVGLRHRMECGVSGAWWVICKPADGVGAVQQAPRQEMLNFRGSLVSDSGTMACLELLW